MDDFLRRPRRSRLNLGQMPQAMVAPESQQTSPMNVTPPPPQQQFNPPSPEEIINPQPPKNSRFRFPKLRKPRNRKEWIIAIVSAIVALSLIGFAIYWFVIRDTSPALTVQETVEHVEPEPTTVPSKMTGLEVDRAVNERPVFAVQIENSREARPQSGLIDADIVFEAVAEGGITRFNALYHDNLPKNIGPIRSLRPYYIDWFWPFDAAIVHAGGSPEALNDVGALGLKDIDHGGSSAGAFRRITSRYSPHNLYSTSEAILDAMKAKGYTKSEFTGFPRKEPAPAETPSAKTINLRISSALYNVSFAYDKENNIYLRSQGGAAHKDADNGKQIKASVVIVPVLSKGIHPDGVHTRYGTTGSGDVYIFQDGVVTKGTWKKSARNKQWQFTDSTGKEISLNPGKTWVTIIDSAASVSYTP